MSQWLIYSSVFAFMMIVDFIIMRGRDVTVKRSLSMTVFYMAISVLFSGYVYYAHGGIQPASQYLTIYGLEQMLSVDNLLVISLIFSYFGISPKKQHTALLYGIVGALFFRGLFILSGGWLLQKVEWLLFVFAAFLLYSGIQILRGGDSSFDPDQRKLIRFLKKHVGASSTFIAAIIAIELSDIMFAVDSIPASFSVSKDSFVILTANLFAVMGLRSLYHAVAHGISLLDGIEKYIGIVLMFLGAEIFFNRMVFEIPSYVTMAVVFGTLVIGVIFTKANNLTASKETVKSGIRLTFTQLGEK